MKKQMKKTVLRKTLALLLCAALFAGLTPAAFADDYSVRYQLPAPVLLDASNVAGGVQVSWEPVNGAPQYGVIRATEGGPWQALAVAQGTSYVDTGVEYGVNYTYTVCCLSADGRSVLSPFDETGATIKSVTESFYGNQLPAPSLGSAFYYNGGVTVDWNGVMEATRYGIFRSTNGGPWKGLAIVANTTYRDEAVEPGVTYSYTVCCVSNDGRRLMSPYNETGVSVTIPSGRYDLPAPVLLDASNVAGGVQVSWEPVNGAFKYGVFRKTEDGPWKGLAVCLNTSYKDETVEPGVNYTYTVCCLTSDGKALQSPYDETGIGIKAGTGARYSTQFPTPVLLDAENYGRGVRVSWEAVSGAPQYGIFRKTEDGPWKGLVIVQETSYVDTAVEPGLNYTYTVCCVSADGRSLLSPYDETGMHIQVNAFTGGTSAFYTQPKDQGAKQMTYAMFTVKARDSQVRYQWEMRAKDAAQWYPLPEIAWLIGGVNTDTLIIGAVLGLNGYNFRCLISDGQYAEYSDIVTLHVVP